MTNLTRTIIRLLAACAGSLKRLATIQTYSLIMLGIPLCGYAGTQYFTNVVIAANTSWNSATNVVTGYLIISNGASLSLGGSSVLSVSGDLVVSNNANLICQATNRTTNNQLALRSHS